MDVKCDYCGQFIDDQLEKCPYCGAENENIKRFVSEDPKTIEELKEYCEKNGYTAEKTRFFIGVDYKEPRAFGIYKDSTGKFVVYKNKANGERAVRYNGKDEAYAVQELYQRLQDEIINQKQHQLNRSVPEYRGKNVIKKGLLIAIAAYAFSIIFALSVFTCLPKTKNGHYRYNNDSYYHLGSSWYLYDTGYGEWEKTDNVPKDLEDNYDDYDEPGNYSASYGVPDFKDTDFYSDWEETRSSSSSSSDRSSDRSSSYSSDSWDSGATDWDSDW